MSTPRVGVLALQGDTREHLAALADRPRPAHLPLALDLVFDQLETLIDQNAAAADLLAAVEARRGDGGARLGRLAGLARRLVGQRRDDNGTSGPSAPLG